MLEDILPLICSLHLQKQISIEPRQMLDHSQKCSKGNFATRWQWGEAPNIWSLGHRGSLTSGLQYRRMSLTGCSSRTRNTWVALRTSLCAWDTFKLHLKDCAIPNLRILTCLKIWTIITFRFYSSRSHVSYAWQKASLFDCDRFFVKPVFASQLVWSFGWAMPSSHLLPWHIRHPWRTSWQLQNSKRVLLLQSSLPRVLPWVDVIIAGLDSGTQSGSFSWPDSTLVPFPVLARCRGLSRGKLLVSLISQLQRSMWKRAVPCTGQEAATRSLHHIHVTIVRCNPAEDCTRQSPDTGQSSHSAAQHVSGFFPLFSKCFCCIVCILCPLGM